VPQRTDKHYNDFGGLDTSTNLLKMNPKTQRRGSKNWRYNYDDQYAQRYGFQHKSKELTGFEFGLGEYKYRDINTGESKTEVIGVGADGFLYKRRIKRLKMVRSSGLVQFYNIYLTDGTPEWTFNLLEDDQTTEIFTVSFDTTYTLDDLVADITAATITGFSASIVDEEGNATTSDEPAYLLQTTVMEEFNTTGSDTEYNDVWYSEIIPSPGDDPLFPEVLDDDITGLSDFEGATFANLNNSIYIACGGWLVKYDGFTAYYAGLPKIMGHQSATSGVPSISGGTNNSGYAAANNTVGSGNTLATGNYYYNFRLVHRDASGSLIYGAWNEEAAILQTISNNSMLLTLGSIKYDPNYPIYSATVYADSTDNATTIQVEKGHNLLVGMTMRFQYYTATPSDSWKRISYQQPVFWYSKINSIDTSNGSYDTITINTALHYEVIDVPSPGTVVRTSKVKDGMIINAYFAEDQWDGKLSANVDAINIYNQTVIGASIEVYRRQLTTSDWLLAWILPVSYDDTVSNTFIDDDSSITAVSVDDTLGGEIPRACRYISTWQQQLVQGGRPYDPSIKDDNYPTSYQKYAVGAFGAYGPDLEGTYTEASLCDFQSVYWCDAINPEGFTRSGANEEDFQGLYQDQVRGFAENKSALFVMKDRTVGLLTGTVATNDITKEILETDAGCSSFNSIQDVSGSLVWCDVVGGFWSCVAGRLPEYLGALIQDDFRKNLQVPRNQRLLPSRAKSTNFRLDNHYICFIPAGWIEDGESGANPIPTEYSLAFVYDYSENQGVKRSCWYQWQDIYPNAGLLSTSRDELIFSENRDDFTMLWKQKRTGTKYDMADNDQAIELNIKSAWLNYGIPTIDKDFVNFWVNSVQGGFTIRMDQYYNYIDTLQSSYDIVIPEATDATVGVKHAGNLNVTKLSAVSIGLYHNTINELVKMDGFEIVYAADFDPGEPKK